LMSESRAAGLFQYKTVSGGIKILSYTGEDDDVVIPESIGGTPVTELGAEAFSFTPAEKVTVPASVKFIEDPADLCAVRLVIDEKNPFYSTDGCAIYHQTENGGILCGVSMADGRSEYEVREGTSEIVPGAFRGCPHLERIVLPASLENLGECALDSSDGRTKDSGLREILVREGNPYFRIEDQALISCGRGSGNAATGGKAEEGDRLLRYFGNAEDYRIPGGITSVGPRAFRGARLKTIRIPAGICRIGAEALKDCAEIEKISLEADSSEIYVPALAFRKEEVFRLLGDRMERSAEDPSEKAESVFDYGGYDALFDTYPYTEYRMKMAFCRFDAPVLLSRSVREHYREYLSFHLDKILKVIAEKEDSSSLRKMMQYGFFTEENIFQVLDYFSIAAGPLLTEPVLRYKQEHFPDCQPDMEL